VRGIWKLKFVIWDLGFGNLSCGLTQFQLDWIHMLNLDEMMEKLPHRSPFRMIDRILEIEPGKKAIALKNVSLDEPHLSGHFPGDPVMPGILVLEALAQTGGLAFHSQDETEGGIPFLARIEEFRLKRKVIPGDRLILEAEVLRVFSNLAVVRTLARVGDEPVAEGTLILAKGQKEHE
jgi:3-hydroxyacyl-[acyl-carrier-protein] dehydratase